ncbi:MAG: ATP-binding protein [Bacillota bacterium]
MVPASCGEARRSVEWRIVSHPANLAVVRRGVEALAGQHGFDLQSRDEIGLCVNEALANVIRHAYRGAVDQPIVITVTCLNEAIQITIRDWGNGIDPLDQPAGEYDPLQGGGVGLICLKGLMDKIAFSSQSDGMLLTMMRLKVRETNAQGRS